MPLRTNYKQILTNYQIRQNKISIKNNNKSKSWIKIYKTRHQTEINSSKKDKNKIMKDSINWMNYLIRKNKTELKMKNKIWVKLMNLYSWSKNSWKNKEMKEI